jgi:deoxyribodipyrimidine photo-lyase
VRVPKLNGAAIGTLAGYVLYWSLMNRCVESNHALAHAVSLTNELDLPLRFYEGLTCIYPHANDRRHPFVFEAVPETERRTTALGIGYVFCSRRRRPDPDDMLYRLAGEAAAVVTDDYPAFIAAEHNARVLQKIGVACFAVDSNCVVPMNCFDKREYAAYTIRPKIRELLPEHLKPACPIALKRRWRCRRSRFHTTVTESNIGELVTASEIDHTIACSRTVCGGRTAAEMPLHHFLRCGLRRYAREKSEPAARATSRLHLHFGHLSTIEVALVARDYTSRHKIIAEEFLEELIVGRELAFNFPRFTPCGAALDDLPEWACLNLKKHAPDRCRYLYTRDEFVHAQTHDALWNATQKQMRSNSTSTATTACIEAKR